MKATDLNFDLYALAAPRSRADMIALVKEARAELALINGILDDVLSQKNCAAEA